MIDKVEGSLFNYSVKNSLIKFNPTSNAIKNIPEMDFENNTNYSKVIINGNPNFRDTQKSDFIIGAESDAINKAIATPFTIDISGTDRATNPDIGAYQHIIFETEE